MPALGAGDGVAGNIGGDQIDGPAIGGSHRVQHHGQRLGFLAGGAGRRPDAQAFFIAPAPPAAAAAPDAAAGRIDRGSRKKQVSFTVIASVTAAASASWPSRSSLHQRVQIRESRSGASPAPGAVPAPRPCRRSGQGRRAGAPAGRETTKILGASCGRARMRSDGLPEFDQLGAQRRAVEGLHHDNRRRRRRSQRRFRRDRFRWWRTGSPDGRRSAGRARS